MPKRSKAAAHQPTASELLADADDLEDAPPPPPAEPLVLPAALLIEAAPIDSITPYERNPRRNAATIAKTAASIREFGWRQPIVVDEQRIVIVGHARLAAARSLGLTHVPVHVAVGLSPMQAKAYRLADNRTADESTWNDELLALELDDLAGGDFDLALTGFDANEIMRAIDDAVATGIDPAAEWQGMPEYTHEAEPAYCTVRLHFVDDAAIARFARLIGQPVTAQTRFLWYPPQESRGTEGKLTYETDDDDGASA